MVTALPSRVCTNLWAGGLSSDRERMSPDAVRMNVAAVVLAAGRSRRMGQPKPVLPLGGTTVLEQIVRALREGGVETVLVVTGHARDQVAALAGRAAAREVHNPDYARKEMLSSVQVGLRALPQGVDAALICLGDQPRLRARVVRAIIAACAPDRIVVPSYRMRRGHPVLLPRAFWPEVLAAPPGSTLRDVLHRHEGAITHVVVDDESVLADMDTPEEYERERRRLEEHRERGIL